MPKGFLEHVVTARAAGQMRYRGLDETVVANVVRSPQQREARGPGRAVLQSLVEIDATQYLVRVIVDLDQVPVRVITAYRTSKISKYWRVDP